MPGLIPQVPEFELVYLNEVMTEFVPDDVYSSDFPLEAFWSSSTNFGQRWFKPFVRVTRALGRHKMRSAPTQDVRRDIMRWLELGPFHWGEAVPFDQDDLDIMNFTSASQTDKARLAARRAALVRERVQVLGVRYRNWKYKQLSDAMSKGKHIVDEHGIKNTVDFRIPRLNLAGADNYRLPKGWDDPAADIVADLMELKRVFKERFGREATILFSNSRLDTMLVKNTAFKTTWLPLLGAATIQAWLAQRTPTLFGGLGFQLPFGLGWVMDGHRFYDEKAGAEVDSWPANTITLAAPPDEGMEPLWEFMKSQTYETNYTGGPVLDTHESDEPKGLVRVRGYGNGIAAMNYDDRMMILEDVTDGSA